MANIRDDDPYADSLDCFFQVPEMTTERDPEAWGELETLAEAHDWRISPEHSSLVLWYDSGQIDFGVGEQLAALLENENLNLELFHMDELRCTFETQLRLLRAIENNQSIRRLRFSAPSGTETDEDDQLFSDFASVLGANVTWEYLVVRFYGVSAQSLRSIIQALGNNESLTCVHLDQVVDHDEREDLFTELDSSLVANKSLETLMLESSAGRAIVQTPDFGLFFPTNTTLKRLELFDMDLPPPSSASLFWNGFKHNATLETLKLSTEVCHFSFSTLVELASVLPLSGLRTLILEEGASKSDSTLSSEAVLRAFATALDPAKNTLASQSRLKKLFLCGTSCISQASVEAFRDMLKSNFQLTTLDLSFCHDTIRPHDARHAEEEAAEVDDREADIEEVAAEVDDGEALAAFQAARQELLVEIDMWLDLTKHFDERDNLPSRKQLQLSPQAVSAHQWIDVFDSINDNLTYVYHFLRNDPVLCSHLLSGA